MASKVQKPCRICGKMFTPCADCENDKTMFRWKRVACSPECAKEYFSKVEAIRLHLSENSETCANEAENMEITNTVSKENTVVEDIKPKRTRKKNDIKIEESEQIE